MGVGSHHRIRIHLAAFAAEHHRRQVFQVDLVHDARIGRHHAEIAERRLPPSQQGVSFAVALEFQEGVEIEGVFCAEVVHLHRVVDHQIGGQQGVGALGVGAHGRQGIAHGCQIHHARHARKILQ